MELNNKYARSTPYCVSANNGSVFKRLKIFDYVYVTIPASLFVSHLAFEFIRGGGGDSLRHQY